MKIFTVVNRSGKWTSKKETQENRKGTRVVVAKGLEEKIGNIFVQAVEVESKGNGQNNKKRLGYEKQGSDSNESEFCALELGIVLTRTKKKKRKVRVKNDIHVERSS